MRKVRQVTRRRRAIIERFQVDRSVGQISQNLSSPFWQKYFACKFGKSEIELRHLIPEEGRRPSPPNVGMSGGGR
jgi:hypothetical protein